MSAVVSRWLRGPAFFFFLLLSTLAVHAQTCSIPGQAGQAGIAAQPNTFFPGTNSPAAGATSITVGAGTGVNRGIEAGDLLLVIQVQGADLDQSDDRSYGNGAGTGNGTTQPFSAGNNYAGGNLNDANFIAGNYEWAVATGGGATFGGGGTINLSVPLVNAYFTRANTTALTKRSWQVVRVPQYSNLQLTGGLTMQPWNGSSGGMLVLEATGDIDLNGQTINGSGRGFRGAGAVETNANAACTAEWDDFNNNPCKQYRALANASLGGSKGEGLAGTPLRIYNGDPAGTGAGTVGATAGDGYPSGEAARGAPGNAGGGGNQHNGGGGGGGNGGAGGQGGNTWNSSNAGNVGLMLGGSGGSPSGNASARWIMGGGGGAGDVGGNTVTPPDGSGGAGGGIVVLRASRIDGGGATINVDGAPGQNARATDAGGGGGAGGTVIITASTAAVAGGLTVNARGGRGGNYTTNVAEQDGTGGGGGGGVVLSNVTGVTFAAANRAGGAAGTSASTACDGGADCGQDPGVAGAAAAGYTGTADGVLLGYECLPQLTVTKTTTTPLVTTSVGATANYVITITNSGGGARFVTLEDYLPPGWAPAGGTAPVYSPSAAGQLPTGGETVALAHTAPWSVGALPLTIPTVPISTVTISHFALAPVRLGVPAALTFTFVASIPDTATVGTYHNPSGVDFLDPTRAAASTRVVSPQANVTANRTATAYAPNTYNNYNGAATTNVAGSNYSGLVAGPAGENVRLIPDFSITKTAPATATPLQTFSYVITPRNNGRPVGVQVYSATQATDVTLANVPATLGSSPLTVTDTFPTAGVTLTTAFAGTGWTCTGSTVIVCTLANANAYPIAAATDWPTLSATARLTRTCIVSTASVTNTATISVGAGESVTTNNTDTAVVDPGCVTAHLTLTKTDGAIAVLTGSTISYTLTVANLGPGDAPGTVVRDPAVAGLSCSTVTCSVAAGAAACPASPTIATLQGPGLVIPSFDDNSTLTFVLTCGVTATGQ